MNKITALIAFVLLTIGTYAFGQNGPKANHVALYVKDLSKSAAFYKDVMQLKVNRRSQPTAYY
jgi:catechol-2,3-dioxygenase